MYGQNYYLIYIDFDHNSIIKYDDGNVKANQ